jgi:hypothetical protein
LAVGSTNHRRRKGMSVRGRGGNLVLWLGAEEEKQGPPRQGGSLGMLGANVGWFKVQQNLSLGCQDIGH